MERNLPRLTPIFVPYSSLSTRGRLSTLPVFPFDEIQDFLLKRDEFIQKLSAKEFSLPVARTACLKALGCIDQPAWCRQTLLGSVIFFSPFWICSNVKSTVISTLSTCQIPVDWQRPVTVASWRATLTSAGASLRSICDSFMLLSLEKMPQWWTLTFFFCLCRASAVVRPLWRSCSRSTRRSTCCSTAPTRSTDSNWITASWPVRCASDRLGFLLSRS